MLKGIERTIAELRDEIAKLEDDVSKKRAEVERLIAIEEATVSALGTLDSVVRELQDGDKAEVKDALLGMFSDERLDTTAIAHAADGEEFESAEAGDESESLSDCVTYCSAAKTAQIRFGDEERAGQWAWWISKQSGETAKTSLERSGGYYILTAVGVERAIAVALSRAHLGIPPTLEGRKKGISSPLPGDIVRVNGGYEFEVRSTTNDVVELTDYEGKTIRYPASAVAVIMRPTESDRVQSSRN